MIGTAGSERGRTLVKEQGAHHVLDHHAADFADHVAKITNGKGPDVILEMLANVNLAKDLQMIGARGRIVVIGNRGTIEINPRDAMAKDASVHGMLLFNATRTKICAEFTPHFMPVSKAGSLHPVVGTEFKLEDAPKAHETCMQAGAFGKIASDSLTKMRVFGHRGSPGFPRFGENTLTSFRKALDAGAAGIELDVRRCGDGTIVVIHDATIDRTTNGAGPVSGLSYAQLSRFDAGHGDPFPGSLTCSTYSDRAESPISN